MGRKLTRCWRRSNKCGEMINNRDAPLFKAGWHGWGLKRGRRKR